MSRENTQYREKPLPPGSDEALQAGCLCPVGDNYHGEGRIIDGKVNWYINPSCPVHGIQHNVTD